MLSVTRALVSSALVSFVWSDEFSLIQDVRSHLAIQRPRQSSAAGLMEVASKMLAHGVGGEDNKDNTAAETFVLAISKEILGDEDCEVVDALNKQGLKKDCVSTATDPDFCACALGTLSFIEHAHRVDQKSINAKHSEFQQWLDNLHDGNLKIVVIEESETKLSADHSTCRDEELKTECTDKIACDKTLYGLWKTWYEAEKKLSEKHSAFSKYFCDAEGNSTADLFRNNSVIHMTKWIDAEKVTVTAKDGYESFVGNCKTNYTALVQKGNTCDDHQKTLEKKSCVYANKVSSVVSDFACNWDATDVEYGWFEGMPTKLVGYEGWKEPSKDSVTGLVNTIKQEEQVRIQEYETLRVVQCLMEEIHNRNGQPCGVITAELEVTKCQKHRHDLDTTKLMIDYPKPPLKPPSCIKRKLVDDQFFWPSVSGSFPSVFSSSVCQDATNQVSILEKCPSLCLPEEQPVPCTEEYKVQEFNNLAEFPTAPFSETNPACNAQPTCEDTCALAAYGCAVNTL